MIKQGINIYEGNCIIHITKHIRKELIQYGDNVSIFLMMDVDNVDQEFSEQISHLCSNPTYKNVQIMQVNNGNIGKIIIDNNNRVLLISIGDSDVINSAKYAMAHCLETNKNVTAHMILVPLEFGGIGETSDLAVVKADVFLTPRYSKYLSCNRISRDIILDSGLLYKVSSNKDMFRGVLKLVYNGIDLTFAINNRYSKGLSLVQEIYSLPPIIIENIINFPSTADILNIPILQRLSILSDMLTSEVGRSIIHAITYPFINRSMNYYDAIYFIAPVIYTKHLSSKNAPKAKISIASIEKMAIKLKTVPTIEKQVLKLFDINAMISEIHKYADMYFTNTSFNVNDKDLFVMISDIIQLMEDNSV